jgi:hypothetical protein
MKSLKRQRATQNAARASPLNGRGDPSGRGGKAPSLAATVSAFIMEWYRAK